MYICTHYINFWKCSTQADALTVYKGLELTEIRRFGNPFEREPEKVRADVQNGYVSIEQARDAYGVVITGDPEFDPEGLIIDEAQTRRLRG